LAERGAAYSAQAEFIQALKLISQALDQEHGTRFHGRAMSAGLRALREADDFVAGDSDDLQAIDLAHCVAAHRTPLLKNVDTTEITPMDALQEYHTFASQQLAAACGRESAGSKALYGLARLQPVLNVGSEPRRSTAETNAIALHQAALTVDPRNHTAANELGVLLARYGQMEAAQSLLRQSLAVRQTAEAWRNLTVVYQEMGAMDAAGWARRQGEIFAASPSSQDNAPESPKESMVYWVDAATLARGSGAAEPVGPVMPTTPPAEPQIASPWPREVPMTAASPEPAPASNPVEQFKSFFGLGEQGHETRDMPPETTSRPQRETLR